MPTDDEIAGIILAGGLSRRMFAGLVAGAGSDKGLLDLAGKPMLGHVIDRLGPQVGALAINANGDPARFAAFGLPVVADPIDGFVGPLAGVLAGMMWARESMPSARWVASASADAPFVPADLVIRLRAALDARGDAVAIAHSSNGLHPVIGLWPVALAEDLDSALRNGLRKVLHWTDRHGTVPVHFDDLDIAGTKVDPFFNANTPDELAEAKRLMAQRSAG